nr:nucleotidyltransferase family protein [Natronococcus occultus]
MAGILLAAGTSSRFGSANKLLARLDGEPVIRQAAKTLLASTLDSTTVVVGFEADRVREALRGRDVSIVENPAYDRGQATSMRTGLRAVQQSVDAVVFMLGDLPAVTPDTIDLLTDAYHAGVGDALAAAYDGDRGNPVLFDSRHFPALLTVSGDTGGRRVLLEDDASALIETEDPGTVQDLNTAADLETLDQWETDRFE